jgi:hypothetical protein
MGQEDWALRLAMSSNIELGITIMMVEAIMSTTGITMMMVTGITIMSTTGITIMMVTGITIMMVTGITMMMVTGITDNLIHCASNTTVSHRNASVKATVSLPNANGVSSVAAIRNNGPTVSTTTCT